MSLSMEAFKEWELRRYFSKRRLELYEDYLDSGEDFRRYLEFSRELMEGRKDPAVGAVDRILEVLARGAPVAEALASVAPAADVTMLTAWESRGLLNKGVEELIVSVREEQELRSSAMSDRKSVV